MFTIKDGWGVMDDALLVTHDGGVSWASVPLPGASFNLSTGYVFFTDQFAYFLVPASDGQTGLLLTTKNGGGTWQVNSVPFAQRNLHFINVLVGFASGGFGAQPGSVTLYATYDSGQTWSQFYDQATVPAEAALPANGLPTGMSFIDPSQGWVGYSAAQPGELLLYRSYDSGRTWLRENLSLPENAKNALVTVLPPFFIRQTGADGFLPVDLFSPETGLSSRLFYATHDVGTTWTPGEAIVEGGAYTFLDAKTGWAWGKRGIYQTTDGAQTWFLLPAAFNRAEHGTWINFIDPEHGWLLTVDAKSRVRLYRTTNGGYGWETVIP
jgi:photosystem II stability/assembly factor-like uncharacterized protein